MKEGIIRKARGPLPTQDENGFLRLSAEGFSGADIYRAIAGRAKIRADKYYRFIVAHCDMEQPDYSSSGNLEVYVAWAAFACEVYLKSLIIHLSADQFFREAPDGTKKIKIHPLEKLFEMLKTVSNEGNAYAIRISEALPDFVERLNNSSKYFEQYRYDYELADEEMDVEFVFGLMKKLQSITDEVKFVGSMEIARTPDGGIMIS